MNAMSARFAQAQKLADAVLYEGYVLYPYRASARKNQMRWQFGVLAPRDWCEAGGCENSWIQAECLIEPGERPALTGLLRFLHPQRRTVEDAQGRDVATLEAEGQLWTAWDEGVAHEVEFAAPLSPGTEQVIPFTVSAGLTQEPLMTRFGRPVGRLLRERQPLTGEVRVGVERVAALSPLLRLRVRVDNLTATDDPGAPRDQALRQALAGAHILLAATDAAFLSLVDPPEWARPAAAACENVRTWPVLVGLQSERGVMLASPIILADHAQIAPASAGDLYDATEIDEILTLRTLTLTEDEKREARATDPRAAALIDRVDATTLELLDRLHGTLRSGDAADPRQPDPGAPFWDPSADGSVSPDTDAVEIAGQQVTRGCQVRLRPGKRRADAHDMFFAGRVATVRGVFRDVEERRYVAVTLDDDPGADLQQQQGRYLYFDPDEIEPVEARP